MTPLQSSNGAAVTCLRKSWSGVVVTFSVWQSWTRELVSCRAVLDGLVGVWISEVNVIVVACALAHTFCALVLSCAMVCECALARSVRFSARVVAARVLGFPCALVAALVVWPPGAFMRDALAHADGEPIVQVEIVSTRAVLEFVELRKAGRAVIGGEHTKRIEIQLW